METWLVEYDNGETQEFTGSVSACWAAMLCYATGNQSPAWVSAVKISDNYT